MTTRIFQQLERWGKEKLGKNASWKETKRRGGKEGWKAASGNESDIGSGGFVVERRMRKFWQVDNQIGNIVQSFYCFTKSHVTPRIPRNKRDTNKKSGDRIPAKLTSLMLLLLDM